MLKVMFSDGEKTVETEMTQEEIELIVKYKPDLDFDGDSWKITDFRYDLDSSLFKFWMDKV